MYVFYQLCYFLSLNARIQGRKSSKLANFYQFVAFTLKKKGEKVVGCCQVVAYRGLAPTAALLWYTSSTKATHGGIMHFILPGRIQALSSPRRERNRIWFYMVNLMPSLLVRLLSLLC
jgi:hypothetical protein